MAEKQSLWTTLNAVLGGIAAIVTAITGLYLAFKHDPAPTTPSSIPVTAASAAAPSSDMQTESGTTYDRTPWLGVELHQNDRPIRLRSLDGAWDKFEATLATGSFEITITRHADSPAIGILAWHDDSVFNCVQPDGQLHLPGTGIAGAEFAVPILYLNKEGFNYYDTGRLKRVADDKYSIFISTIAASDLELPLPRFAGPLYLIIFRVPDGFEMTVPPRNFELITLRRQ